MASKRKSYQTPLTAKFRPPTESPKWETKGTRPLPNPVSVKGVFLTMVLHICRKILFMNTYIKVGLYLAGIFLSFIWDLFPFPKTYFARSDNFFNLYFVKLGWGWTLILTLPFVLLTSFTYCCGNRKQIIGHLSRLGIATLVWFVFTKSFVFIEHNFGQCSVKGEKYANKQACISKGFYWHSLDISGHAFILIWSCLVIIEEARAIIGWDTITDLIRDEEHSRSISEVNVNSSVKHLTKEEFQILKSSFKKFSFYVKGLFIAMTALTVLWDVMILSTMLYFHHMVEKLISGILAVGVWLLTYQYWYSRTSFLPKAPGDGLFKYNKGRQPSQTSLQSRGSINRGSSSGQGPRFMGMPLYTTRSQENKDESSKDEFNNMDENSTFKANSTSKVNSTPDNRSTGIRQGVVTRSQGNNSASKNRTV